MPDIFTYENNAVTTGEVASADYAAITIGGHENSLVQNCTVNYGQTVEEITQVGSTAIFWMPGKARGNVAVDTLVGTEGFFKGWDVECGKIETGTVDIDGGRCGFKGTGTLTFDDGVIESVSATLSTGRQAIAQNMSMRIASLKNS